MSEDIVMDGWTAIEEAFLRRYPGQTSPKHYGTLISWELGGDDPLRGISVYDGGDYWHFVSFGLSELYEKESDNKEYSGFGMEFTLKLSKEGLDDEEAEIRGICGILQSLARMTFNDGSIFRPFEYIYTGQTTGMDTQAKSDITGFITVADEEINSLDTPNGRVEFIQFIGATDAEIRAVIDKKLTNRELYEKLGSGITDYTRHSII